jgi:hypothetical protein
MKKVTLTEIKKSVIASGGAYRKAKCYLNGQDAYYVNDKLLSKGQMIELFLMGDL